MLLRARPTILCRAVQLLLVALLLICAPPRPLKPRLCSSLRFFLRLARAALRSGGVPSLAPTAQYPDGVKAPPAPPAPARRTAPRHCRRSSELARAPPLLLFLATRLLRRSPPALPRRPRPAALCRGSPPTEQGASHEELISVVVPHMDQKLIPHPSSASEREAAAAAQSGTTRRRKPCAARAPSAWWARC